jgi:hypothetical protein
MSRADTGGFDLVLGLSPEYLLALAGRHLPTTVAKTIAIDKDTFLVIPVDTHFHLTCTATMGPEGAVVTPGPTWDAGATVALSYGVKTQWAWDDIVVLGGTVLAAGVWPPPGDPAAATPLLIATGTTTLSTADGSLVLDDPGLTLTIPPGGLDQLPGVTAVLAAVRTIPAVGAALAQWITDQLYDGLTGGLNVMIAELLPNRVSVVKLPAAWTTKIGVAKDHPGDVLAMIAFAAGTYNGEPPGLLLPVQRSPLRHRPDGTARDLAGLAVGNYWLLRDVLRPPVAKALSLLNGQFAELHPFWWFGSAPLVEKMGMGFSIVSLGAQIDSAGALRFDGSVSASALGDGITIRGTVSVGLLPTTAAGKLNLGVQEPVVHLDCSVAWWAWLLSVVVGPAAIATTAIVDACLGGEMESAVAGALKGKMPSVSVDLPTLDGMQPAVVSTSQPDAEWQLARIFGMTIPLSRCNDVVLALGSA